MTQMLPLGTWIGPNGSSSQGGSPGGMYDFSSSALPLTTTGPPFLQDTVSPPTAMTRLIRSFSSADGIRPTRLRNFCTALGVTVGSPSSQPPGSWKTTTSPREGSDPNHGVSLSTST